MVTNLEQSTGAWRVLLSLLSLKWSHYVAWASLKITMQTRLASNTQRSDGHFLFSAGIKGTCYYTRLRRLKDKT